MNSKYHKGLAYEEIGEDNDEIILFLHSKIVSSWIWKKQKESYGKFFKGYHCIFLDLPHHGKSQSEGQFTIDDSSLMIMDFILDLIDEKNSHKTNHLKKIDSIDIVALGLGASIALEIMSRNPKLIGHLILSGIEIAPRREIEEESILNRMPLTKAEYLNMKPDRFIVSAYLRYYGIGKDCFDHMEKDLDMSIKKEKEIAFESFNHVIPERFKDDEEIREKKSILLIFANKEDLDTAYSAIELKSMLENARLIEIDRGNHLWNMIDHELFNQLIADFIDRETIPE